MESFLDMFVVFTLSISVLANIVFLVNTRKSSKACDKILKEYPEVFGDIVDKIEFNSAEIHRSLLDLKDSIQPIKPSIRPNNWDSMREAFKAPTKVAVDE